MKTDEQFTEVYFEAIRLSKKLNKIFWIVPSTEDDSKYIISDRSNCSKKALQVKL